MFIFSEATPEAQERYLKAKRRLRQLQQAHGQTLDPRAGNLISHMWTSTLQKDPACENLDMVIDSIEQLMKPMH